MPITELEKKANLFLLSNESKYWRKFQIHKHIKSDILTSHASERHSDHLHLFGANIVSIDNETLGIFIEELLKEILRDLPLITSSKYS